MKKLAAKKKAKNEYKIKWQERPLRTSAAVMGAAFAGAAFLGIYDMFIKDVIMFFISLI